MTITGISTNDSGDLLMQLSNGTTLGPVPLPRAPLSLRGDWATGAGYFRGDIINHPTGSYICAADHEAGDFDDDLDAMLWQQIGGGAAAAQPVAKDVFASGSVAVPDRLLHQFGIPAACTLTTIVVSIGTTIDAGAGGLDVVLKRRTLFGAETTLATVTLGPNVPAATTTVAADLAATDVLQVHQVGGEDATGGSDLAVTFLLTPA